MVSYRGNTDHIYITLFNEGRTMYLAQQNFADGDTWYNCWPNKGAAESLPRVVAVWSVKKKVNLPVGQTGSIYMRKPDEHKHDPKEGEEEATTPPAEAPAETEATEPVVSE